MKKAIAVLLTLVLCVGLIPLQVFAVTGNETAADGTYTSHIVAMENKVKSTTVVVTVTDGIISDITFSGGSASDFKKYLITKTYGTPPANEISKYLNQEATVNTVDALSGASRNTSTKYNCNLQGGISNALSTATAKDENGVVADGTYNAPISAVKIKNKESTLQLTVKEGKITDISFTGGDASDFKKYLITKTYGSPSVNEINKYLNQEATVNTIDALSGASVNTSTKYDADLKGTIIAALETAPAAESGSEDEDFEIKTGKSAVMSNGHYVTIDVKVKDGKIAGISVNSAETDGDWDSLVNEVSANYVGKEAEISAVDAVSGATSQGYREAIRQAVYVALGGSLHTHNLTLNDAVAATCESDGSAAYYTCDGCGKWFNDANGSEEITDKNSVIIPALGHDWGEWTVVEATKTTDGYKTRTCKNDPSHVETEVLKATGIDITVKGTALGTVSGDIAADGADNTENFAYGTDYTITAEYDDTKVVFVGWEINGKLVSKSETYTNTAYTDLTITPVFQELQENTITVIFYDKYGNALKHFDNVTVEEYKAGLADLKEPALQGYTFTGWDTDIENITESTIVTAQYEKDSTGGYTITADGAEIVLPDGIENGAIPYDTQATVTFEGAEAISINDVIVAYSDTYTFYVGTDVTLTPVYNVEKVEPTVVVEGYEKVEDSTRYNVLATDVVPVGYTIIDRGFIYGKVDSFPADYTADINDVPSGVRVYHSTPTEANQFAINFGAKAGLNMRAIAYITVQGENGTEVIYSTPLDFVTE